MAPEAEAATEAVAGAPVEAAVAAGCSGPTGFGLSGGSTRNVPRLTLFGLPFAVQANLYFLPLTSRMRTFAALRAFRNLLFRAPTEKRRRRFPRFVTAKTVIPARGRFGTTRQARSVIVTRTEAGFADPTARAFTGRASAHSAIAPARASEVRRVTFLLVGG